ncbi:MAG: imidazole glycerol phosphate synthase subunit HisH [Planctomycetota bacterium]
MIAVIDYGLGNLRSVVRGFERIGAQAQPCANADQLAGFDRAVLPGVGAFGDGMALLRIAGWDQALRDFVSAGKPLLGICLGMQLLLSHSTETDAPDPEPGLALIPGRVLAFDNPVGPQGEALKVPHMGWNTISCSPEQKHPLLDGVGADHHVYFVHGYYAACAEPSDVLATCDYGQPFAAVVGRNNVVATQFHPEKSQRVGLGMLERFAGWTP